MVAITLKIYYCFFFHIWTCILFSAAYFYASTQKAADKNGFRLRDENGNGAVIRRYRKEGVTLTLPEGRNLNNIKIFYVWCEDFDVSITQSVIITIYIFNRQIHFEKTTVRTCSQISILTQGWALDREIFDVKLWNVCS